MSKSKCKRKIIIKKEFEIFRGIIHMHYHEIREWHKNVEVKWVFGVENKDDRKSGKKSNTECDVNYYSWGERKDQPYPAKSLL